ncbi:MAG: hypothetical protein WCR48_01075 [Bacteroidales bacterium]
MELEEDGTGKGWNWKRMELEKDGTGRGWNWKRDWKVRTEEMEREERGARRRGGKWLAFFA